jgi:hypothetical protein
MNHVMVMVVVDDVVHVMAVVAHIVNRRRRWRDAIGSLGHRRRCRS